MGNTMVLPATSPRLFSRRSSEPVVPERPANRSYEPPRYFTAHPALVRRARVVLAAVAAGLTLYLFLLSPEGLLARHRLAERIEAARAERARLEERLTDLRAEIAALSEPAGTSGLPEALERIAREELGYRMPGERVLSD